MEEKDRLELESFIDELESHKGRHTELISVYAPAGSNLNAVVKQLEQEKSTAANIKSKTTRKNVMDALEKLTRHLRLYKKIPPNGLAIFCGNIAKQEGQQQIEIKTIEPPLELRTRLYRCDQTFLLEPLQDMLKAKEVYGLITIDRKEATIGLLEGKSIKMLRHLTSGVPGKQKKGGQSAARFSRIREGIVKEFYKRTAEAAKGEFFGMPRLRGLLLGGPGPSKEDFLKEGDLITALREKIIAIKDIGYVDQFGLELLVEASRDILAKEAITKEKELMQRFFILLGKEPEKVAYGTEKVKKALQVGAVEHLLISTHVDKKLIAELEKHAKSIGAIVTLISTETEEGVQFKNISGIGAFLRFPIQ